MMPIGGFAEEYRSTITHCRIFGEHEAGLMATYGQCGGLVGGESGRAQAGSTGWHAGKGECGASSFRRRGDAGALPGRSAQIDRTKAAKLKTILES
ncbi:MAG: hypothetical protein IPP22_04035 [Nitrosomonas sp.]|nr:hypothetical protein [Nitrosomonas sp.]